MRHSVLFIGMVFGLALCGCSGGPVGLPKFEADLDITAEWPKAREDGFFPGQWKFYQYEDAVMHSGLVGPDGFFHVSGHVVCEGFIPYAWLEVTGRYVESDTRCFSYTQVLCENEPQTVTLSDGFRERGGVCEPPDS